MKRNAAVMEGFVQLLPPGFSVSPNRIHSSLKSVSIAT